MKLLTGINIQYPISRLILDGRKTIETRTYPIPEKHLRKELAIIETPGPAGAFKARIVGTIVFESCFPYRSRTAFYKDIKRHHVDASSKWCWKNSNPKWGWKIGRVRIFKNPFMAPAQKGIVFTKGIEISRE